MSARRVVAAVLVALALVGGGGALQASASDGCGVMGWNKNICRAR